jgi:putative FmdB family regulatory protein
MPTYAYLCESCGSQFERWQSIHDSALSLHDDCGGEVVRVITRVATYGIGDRGARTRDVDATERRWGLDMPAYERLRMEGHQPVGIDGAHKLEACARDEWQIKTGGKVSVPDHRKDEINEMLADGKMTDWSPIEQVHANRGV